MNGGRFFCNLCQQLKAVADALKSLDRAGQVVGNGFCRQFVGKPRGKKYAVVGCRLGQRNRNLVVRPRGFLRHGRVVS